LQENETRVTKRRLIRISLLLAIVLGLLAFWFHSREPRHQGKSLSEWLEIWHQSTMKDYEDVPKANAAIRAMGGKAIPFLFNELQVTDSKWKTELNEWLYKTFDWRQKSLSASERAFRAASGFSALGKFGESAIPKIAALVSNSEPAIAEAAVFALGSIESEKTVPILISCLTNQNESIRSQAASAFLIHPAKARLAIPSLINALNETNAFTVRLAVLALHYCYQSSEEVIPALISKLSDSGRGVRSTAAATLGSLGTNALVALPALRQISQGDQSGQTRGVEKAILRVQCEMYQGGIVRGPKGEKKVAFVFTGHEFAEGGETILRELSNHNGRASFFLTGTFYDNPAFKDLLQRMDREGHFLGPHSDKHLLYCSWEDRNKTLVTRDEFIADLLKNGRKASVFRTNSEVREYFLPAFEYYNQEIADWTREWNRTLINFTPGSRSNADYTGEADKNFVSSQKIFDSIVKHEQEDPKGLNGFILLLHIGAGPNRADKFHNRFGELLDYLAAKGYQFVRVDELLEPKDDGTPNANPNQNFNRNPNPNAPFRRR